MTGFGVAEIPYTYVLCQSQYFYSNPAWDGPDSLYDGAGEVVSHMSGAMFDRPYSYSKGKWYANWTERVEIYYRYYYG